MYVGLDAREGMMSHLEDYVADIPSTLIQRKFEICVRKQLLGNVLEKVQFAWKTEGDSLYLHPLPHESECCSY